MKSFQSFAIVPAAGQSARMGTAKLLLTWRGRTLIEHLLSAWLQSAVGRVVVVVRADDELLLECVRRHDVDLVLPSEPPLEMKDSVRAALVHTRDTYQPADDDVWLLSPADLPRLSPDVVNQVLDGYASSATEIVVPACENRRGHPVLFRWALHTHVFRLGENEGVNALLQRFPVREVQTDAKSSWDDVDDPFDFQRLSSDAPLSNRRSSTDGGPDGPAGRRDLQ